MPRNKIREEEKAKSITFSLKPIHIAILDSIVASTGKGKSRLIQELIDREYRKLNYQHSKASVSNDSI